MRILEKRVYVGPNYANFKVIRLLLDLGSLEQHPSAEIDGFVDRLVEAVPSLHEHGCSYRTEGGFIRRMREDRGTWMGHILEHVALELQGLAGSEVTFGKTRGSGEEGQYHVIYEYEDPWMGEQSGELALRLLHHLLPEHLRDGAHVDEDFNFADELETFIKRSENGTRS